MSMALPTRVEAILSDAVAVGVEEGVGLWGSGNLK